MYDLSFLTVDLVFILVFAALLVGLVVFLAVSVRRAKKHPEEVGENTAEPDGGDDIPAEDLTEGDPADDAWIAPEPVAYPARVVDMRVELGNKGGSKRPKTGVSFLVTFLTDDGERMEYAVPEELYVTLNVDQTGTLVILNEGFFDFGDGEDTSDPQ
jgi:hypothetical protein